MNILVMSAQKVQSLENLTLFEGLILVWKCIKVLGCNSGIQLIFRIVLVLVAKYVKPVLDILGCLDFWVFLGYSKRLFIPSI